MSSQRIPIPKIQMHLLNNKALPIVLLLFKMLEDLSANKSDLSKFLKVLLSCELLKRWFYLVTCLSIHNLDWLFLQSYISRLLIITDHSSECLNRVKESCKPLARMMVTNASTLLTKTTILTVKRRLANSWKLVSRIICSKRVEFWQDSVLLSSLMLHQKMMLMVISFKPMILILSILTRILRWEIRLY